MHKLNFTICVTTIFMSATATALAQESEADSDASVDESALPSEAPNDETTEEAEPPIDESAAKAEPTQKDETGAENSKAGGDGGRFRFGISGGPGMFSAKPKGGGTGASFTYGGLDLRFGAQLNDLIGVYAQPVMGYYSAKDVGFLAAGGLLGASVIADVTLIDHFFVGGGFGYHIYNNPGGPSLVLRGGAYPLMGRSKEKIRRKGLMLGADLRVTFLDSIAPVVHPTFNLGYEAF